jgi:hypothetical protein
LARGRRNKITLLLRHTTLVFVLLNTKTRCLTRAEHSSQICAHAVGIQIHSEPQNERHSNGPIKYLSSVSDVLLSVMTLDETWLQKKEDNKQKKGGCYSSYHQCREAPLFCRNFLSTVINRFLQLVYLFFERHST